jgi:hypothetical protein
MKNDLEKKTKTKLKISVILNVVQVILNVLQVFGCLVAVVVCFLTVIITRSGRHFSVVRIKYINWPWLISKF